MKTILSVLCSVAIACASIKGASPGSSIGIAVNPSGNLAFLHVDLSGALILAAAGPGNTVAYSGTGVAVGPDGKLAYLNVDANGGLILSGSPSPTTPLLSVNGGTGVSNSGGTITFGAKNITFSNSLTLSGTDGSTLNVGGGGTLGTGAYQPQTVLTGTSGRLTVTNGGVGGTTLDITYPIGTIAASASDAGTWLQMNGQAVSKTTYATLFSILGHRPVMSWSYVNLIGVGASNTFNNVAWDGTAYVICGNAGTLLTSTNLTSWTSHTSGAANFNAITATTSIFVAVGASNSIYESSDHGVTWNSETSGVTSTLANIKFANSEFVTCGSTGWISHSTNGTSWTATQPNSGPSLAIIAYNTGLSMWFLAPSASGTAGYVFSTDGTTFTFVANPAVNASIYGGYDSGFFYVIDQTTGAVWRSSNGSSWSNSANPGVGSFGGIPGRAGVINGGNLWQAGIGVFTSGYATFTPTFIANGQTYMAIATLAQGFPNDTSSQKFVISTASGNPNATFNSVDGIQMWPQPTRVLSMVGSFMLSNYANGEYFIWTSGGIIGYAPDPYDPSVNFWIPANPANGTALYIKAL